MIGVFEVLKKSEITSADQAKVLAHPLRLQIIAFYDDGLPRTSKQLADLMDMAPSKVHYHVRELVRADLLELVETKEKGGVIEKYYLPVAEQFHINLNETESSAEDKNSTRYLYLKSVLEEFQSSFMKAAEISDQKKAAAKKDEKQQVNLESEIKIPSLSLTHLLLDENEIKLLQSELEALFKKWVEVGRQRKEGTSEEVNSIGFLLSLYEKPTKPSRGSKSVLIK